MKTRVFIATFLFALGLCTLASADDTTDAESAPPASRRSISDHHLWVSVDGGIEGGNWGVNSGGGLGSVGGVGLRVQMGRCGAEVNWDHADIDYVQPDPESRLSVVSGGVACRISVSGEHSRFWRGSHILVRALAEYASNEYRIYDWHSNPVAEGTTYGTGGLLGADLMIPIYFGFFGFGGLSLEAIKFHYSIPDNSQNIHETSDPTTNVRLRVGVAYGFW